ncbi:PaaI family thioesterase [uncultured Marinococcus sp.]|uniref:PaaI family thioesterase n=1 Tax=uncultured Marinococcus sp. TaxID=487012 RepID=UPI00262A9B0A|nr:PaaI family thioesterase [uncultured Marinococcus sp.]
MTEKQSPQLTEQEMLENILTNGSPEAKELTKHYLRLLYDWDASEARSGVEHLMHTSTYWEDEETLCAQIPVHPGLHNTHGIVHGGVLTTIMDNSMGVLLSELSPVPGNILTIDIHVQFISAGTGGKLTCKASPVTVGHRISYAEAAVYDEENQLIAKADGTFYLKQTSRS